MKKYTRKDAREMRLARTVRAIKSSTRKMEDNDARA